VAATLALALGCGALAGCVSTQDKNARAKLVADRTLASRRPLRLHGRSRDVRVLGVSLVRGRRAGALVVELRNRGARALTDVPIAVGVRRADGSRLTLNGGRSLDWFQTHVPAIDAGETTTWVFVPRRRELPAGRPWALAGAVGAAQARAGALPAIAASAAPAALPRALRVSLVNRSDVPQYDVQVYAVARAHGRVVAAGATRVGHLGSRGHAGTRVALVGAPGDHTVRVHALPTIFE
jgi:hypothetical protein